MNALPFEIYLDPLLPTSWVLTICAVTALLTFLSLRGNRRSALLRFVCTLVFLGIFLNPAFIEKEKSKIKDIVVLVTDKSLSQAIGERTQQTETARAHLEEKLKNNPNIELRFTMAPGEKDDHDSTQLFKTLDDALADVPLNRRGGVVFLTDGQVHDVPETIPANNNYGPVHAFLSGRRNEKDRQLVITQSPAYSIVGKPAQVKYKVTDTDNIGGQTARVTIRISGKDPEIFDVSVDEEQSFDIPVEYAGENIVEFEAEGVNGEITQNNNRALAFVNGIRDRMRVLLVTGQPYAGGRTWRDLLKSDPNLDLVQFTILREPEKLDATPPEEMALIAFPFRELFEVKLHNFDLVIFDRYHLNRILPENYFNNIKTYIREGGALLEINGPGFAGEDSLYDTVLRDILPGKPTGEILTTPFVPELTSQGKLHPVTRELPGKGAWGHWLREIEIEAVAGDILMNGAGNTPLLILNRVEEGRIAQLGSDQIWLWARHYDGGGPHVELLRRLIHWLMKEPELDETLLNIDVAAQKITVQSISHEASAANIEMTAPNGITENIVLESQPDDSFKKVIEAAVPGIYAFKTADGIGQYALVGKINAPEMNALVATSEHLAPFSKMTRGKILWMDEMPRPGPKIFNFRDNNNYEITNFREIPFLNAWIALLILAGACVSTWWREGRD
ncbi:MAG: hypothetical protein ACT4OY_03575 [Alphaproteobacteria bacterium]